MSDVQLIVTPRTLSFQASLLHSQKRLIVLINSSDKAVIYSISLSNDMDYKVEPSKGTIEAFDTTEFTVTLSPVEEVLPHCCIVVKSIAKDKLIREKNAQWNSMDVKIELDPKKSPRLGVYTLRTGLKPHDLDDILKKHYNPDCAKCDQQLNRSNASHIIRNGLICFISVFAVCLGSKFLLKMNTYPWIILCFQLILSMRNGRACWPRAALECESIELWIMQIGMPAPSGFHSAPSHSYLNQSYAPLASLVEHRAQPLSRPLHFDLSLHLEKYIVMISVP